MRYGIFVATSCVAVLLAACSGVGTPSGGGPTTSEPTDGDDGGGAAGDGYSSAREAMQSALAEITAVEALPVDTEAQKQAARTRTAAARTQFNQAIAALRSAVEGLEAGSQARADANIYLRGIIDAEIPSRLDAAALRAADIWAAIEGPSLAASGSPSNATFERFPRAEADKTVIPDSRRLSVRTKPVMYSAGKTVFSPDGAGTTDELPMRSLTLRTAGGPGERGDWKIQGNDGTPDVVRNTDGTLDYSIQITPGGLVYKAAGNAIYYDFQRRFNVGGSVDAWYPAGPDGRSGTDDDVAWSQGVDAPVNWNHDDIKVTFGRPIDPNGLNAFFWQTRIPFPDGTSGDDPSIVAKISDHGEVPTIPDLGAYSLWISNYGGLDRGREYADGARFTDDDKDRFLRYAAYGVFIYTDMLVSSRTAARQQGFHFGYDTFADEDKLRTTDIEAGDVVDATFRGATTAFQYLIVNPNKIAANRNEIRGDITLNARIGSGANKISGEITRLEVLNDDGLWVAFKSLLDPAQTERRERLVLAGTDFREVSGTYPDSYENYAADIGADGSYNGGVFLQKLNAAGTGWKAYGDRFHSYWNSTTFPNRYSTFGGTIYGPRDGDFENIETAGYWYLHGRSDIQNWGGIIGSYGAVRTE